MQRKKTITCANSDLPKDAVKSFYCDESDIKRENTKADCELYQHVHTIHLEKKRKAAERSEEARSIEGSFRKLREQQEIAQRVSSLDTVLQSRKSLSGAEVDNAKKNNLSRSIRPVKVVCSQKTKLIEGENTKKFSSFLPKQTCNEKKFPALNQSQPAKVNRSNSIIRPKSRSSSPSRTGFASLRGTVGKPRARSAPGRSLRELRKLTHIDHITDQIDYRFYSLSLSGNNNGNTVISRREKLARRHKQEEQLIQKKVDEFLQRIADFNRSSQQNLQICSADS